jgi:hypothetical protein
MKQAFAPAPLNEGRHPYGFGWAIGCGKEYGNYVNHSGGWYGYSTFIERNLTHDKTIILLQNVSRKLPAVSTIRKILFRLPLEKFEGLPMSEEEMKEYAGRYELSASVFIYIKIEQGKLVAEEGGEALAIGRKSGDLFYVEELDADMQFRRDDDMEINGFILVIDGKEIPAKKIK